MNCSEENNLPVPGEDEGSSPEGAIQVAVYVNKV